MTRVRKQRSNANSIVFENAPRRSEKLADPNSYESRRRRAQEQKKKHKSVYQKGLDRAREREEQSQEQPLRGGRLADKIRKLNAEKGAPGEAPSAE